MENFNFLTNTIRLDGMVNATSLTTAYRNTTGISRECRHWLATQEAKTSINYLEQVSGIPRSSLVVVEHGIGTWLHPDLAEILAQWISVEYRFAVVGLIRREKESLTQPYIPPLEVQAALDIRKIDETLANLNPRLSQFLTDQYIDRVFSQHQLPPSPQPPIRGAAEIAEDLGLPVNISNRSLLGKFLAKQGHEIHRETRLCNGQMRSINCYRQTLDVERSVRLFFR